MGLADVQRVAAAGLATAVLLKAAETWLRTGRAGITAAWLIAASITFFRPVFGGAVVAVLGFGSHWFDYPTNHATLLGWVGAILAVSPTTDLRATLKLLTGVVYGFAVANKLVAGVFLLVPRSLVGLHGHRYQSDG